MTKTLDPTVRFTKLTVDDQTYSLCYDFEAIATAEELTGLPLLVGVDWSAVNARRLRAMLFASALKAHPELTIDELTRHITVKNIRTIENAITETWLASHPEEKTEKRNPPQPEETPANQ